MLEQVTHDGLTWTVETNGMTFTTADGVVHTGGAAFLAWLRTLDPSQPRSSAMDLESYSGRYGSAERIPIESITYLVPQQAACLAGWIITAPGQHVAYDQYQLSVCHLRPIAGAPPAKLQRPGMTHELILHGLDPQRHPDKHNIETLVPIVPLNAAVQFVATDEDAIRLAIGGVRAICDGRLPAEGASEYQCQLVWQAAVDQTLEHMRTGGHAHG